MAQNLSTGGCNIAAMSVLSHIDGPALRTWTERAVSALNDHRDELNALNVFPIPDSDTGSNMTHTMSSAREAIAHLDESASTHEVAAALSKGAVFGSRGNSGVVLSQVLRAMAETAVHGPLDGAAFMQALNLAVELVDRALSDPVEGTILTVLRSSAVAAKNAGTNALPEVVDEALHAAKIALERTPSQLEVLREAGVVDAGGSGYVLMLRALAEVIHGQASHSEDIPSHVHTAPTAELEVMFRFTGDNPEALRADIEPLGRSIIVAPANDEEAMVHIHSYQAGTVIETALSHGRITDIRIEVLPAETKPTRTVVALAPTGSIAELFAEAGAHPVDPGTDAVTAVLAAIVRFAEGDIVLLPNGLLTQRDIRALEAAAHASDRGIVMVPTASLAAGLAAIAVHDPHTTLSVDIYGMSEAAAGMRAARVRHQDDNYTAAVGHEIIAQSDSLDEVLVATVHRLLATGGELVTILLGADAKPQLVNKLQTHLPDGVELTGYDATGMADTLQIGVE